MTDCLVIGGGIIGLTTARELSINGLQVTLIDKGECGRAASWAGAGIITPLYPWKYSDFINELSLKSQQQYQSFCLELFKATKIDPEYINSGLLMLDEFNTDKAKNWLKKWNISYQKTTKGALFNIAQVRNSKILPALKKDLIQRGVTIIENTKISLKYNKNNISILGFKAQNIVVCAGAWSGDFNKNIYPVKGQIITIFDKSNTIKNIVLSKGKYIVPRKDGIVLVGSTMENVGFDTSLDDKTKIELFDFAINIFPHLANYKITNHWCGFRPGNNIDPIIKQDKTYKNLFFNTGHFRNGLNTAPYSAKIISTKIMNNT